MDRIRMRDLVIILPGIMGSVLQKNGQDLWAISGQAILSQLGSLGARLQDLRLGEDDPTKDDLGDGIKATRILQDFHMVPGLVKVDGYTGLRNLFTERFAVVQPDPNNPQQPANYFEFAYDWRRDNRVSARKLKKLIDEQLPRWRAASPANADAKVILIAHSMGGLVSRYYLEVLEGWRDCRALFTFGTPFRGSVNILNFLVYGYKKYFLDLTEVVRSFTSAYQLLPIYKLIAVTGKADACKVCEVDGLPGVQQQRAQAALAFHEEIENAVEAHRNMLEYFKTGYDLLPVVGTHQTTYQSASFANGQLTLATSAPSGLPGFLADGDGTVPWISALPIELSERPRGIFVSEQHASLQNNQAMLDQLFVRIAQLQAPDLGFIREVEADLDPLGDMGLALEVDDLYGPGEPVEIRARVVNARREPQSMLARLQAVGSEAITQLPLVKQDDHWAVTLNTLTPGAYRVEVTAQSAGAQAPPAVHGVFAVTNTA